MMIVVMGERTAADSEYNTSSKAFKNPRIPLDGAANSESAGLEVLRQRLEATESTGDPFVRR
jgi:hypothetical protein